MKQKEILKALVGVQIINLTKQGKTLTEQQLKQMFAVAQTAL
jgi:hypothetical protein